MNLKWFWRGYLAAVSAIVLAVPTIAFGPAVELAVAPVLTAQMVSDVQRSPGRLSFEGHDYDVVRLCWRWDRVKRRPRDFYSNNIDVFVDYAGDTLSTTIFNEATGAGWARSGAVSPGAVLQRWCALLPPSVKPGDPVRVRQIAYYPGFLGLWTLPVHVPDIVDPAPR